MIEQALRLVRRGLERQRDDPVAAHEEAADLAERIDFTLPEAGLGDEATAALLDLVAEATPRTGSVRFLNQLFAGRDDAAIAGELLAVVLNSSMYTFKAAGPNALIERALTKHMGNLVGFAEGEGVFAPGGSMSNVAAIVMARNNALETARARGVDGVPMTLYTSEQSHYSITKGANMAGVGRENVRMIPCDQRGRMDPAALHAAIERDLASGARPFLINATAGTTVLGAFDPLPDLADAAHRYGLWLHVDGAFGASMILSSSRRALLAGIERADSVAWDAHKIMTVPLTCSVILTRRRGLLGQTFSERADYLFQEDSADINFGERSMQCGRRNDALKLWALWKRHGDRGLGRRMDRLVEQAGTAASIIERCPDLDLICAPESVNVCFSVRGAAAERVCEHLRRQNRLIIGYGEANGQRFIRAPFVNPDMTDQQIMTVIEEIRTAGRRLREGAEMDARARDAARSIRGAARGDAPDT